MKMITLLEEMLNTTADEKSTEVNTKDKSTLSQSTTEEEHLTTEEIQYENITKLDKAHDEENTEKTLVHSSGRIKSESSPIIDNDSLKNNQSGDGDNAYFGRKRLFRKPKFLSIREQLEIQKLRQSLRTSTEVITTPSTVHVIPNHFRYPSVRPQVHLTVNPESNRDFVRRNQDINREVYLTEPETHSRRDYTSGDRDQVPDDRQKEETKETNKDLVPNQPNPLDDLEFSNPVELKIPVRFRYPSIREQLDQQLNSSPAKEESNDGGRTFTRDGHESGFSSTHSQYFGDRVRYSDHNKEVHLNKPETHSHRDHTTISRHSENNANYHFRSAYYGSPSSSNSGIKPSPEKHFDGSSYEESANGFGKTSKEYDSNPHQQFPTNEAKPDLSKFQYTFPLQPVYHHENAARSNPTENRNSSFHSTGRSMEERENHLTRKNNVASIPRPDENFRFDGTEESLVTNYNPINPRGKSRYHSKSEDSRSGLHRGRGTSTKIDDADFDRENYPSSVYHNTRTEEDYSQDRSRKRTNGNGRTNVRRGQINGSGRRRRKGRKLRILVKKLPNQPENLGQNPVTNPQTLPERIPDNLLTEIRSKVLKKLSGNGNRGIELQIRYQDHVWNVPFVNDRNTLDISPEICTRAGLFQHPKDCNMFYECFWDKWLKKFTLHVFSCPVKLVYDVNVRGCSRPSTESHCRSA